MSEDLRFENLALQKALLHKHSESLALRERNREFNKTLRDVCRDRDRIFGVAAALTAIASIAAGMSLRYRSEMQEAVHRSAENDRLATQKIRELETANETKLDKLTTLASRLAQVQKRGSAMTPHNNPKSPTQDILINGAHEEKIMMLQSYVGNAYIEMVLNQATHAPSAEDVTVTCAHSEVSPSEVRAYLNGFPSDWLTANVKKITIKKEEYGGASTYTRHGHMIGQFDTAHDSIDIYSATIQGQNMVQFDKTVAHEIAHGNDWLRNEKLTAHERITLLAKIAARVMASDRFISAYVESIATDSIETTHIHTCEEYFAEICAAYFNRPEELNYKDFLIVHELVTKKNPNFNIEEAKRARVYSFSTYRVL